MSKINLETLGCKLNQAETESFAEQIIRKGYQLTDSVSDADIYVLNTCSVTHVADRKARHLLRVARQSNPGAIIAAVGCYARRAPEELKQLGIVDIVLDKKECLIEAIEGNVNNVENRQHKYQCRTRSLIKIQEGCNDFCSFCIVPYTRGRERSLSLSEILETVKARVAAGYQEVTLTGTKIGAFKLNGGSSGELSSLIKCILDQTLVARLRLSSLQPQDITPELVQLWSNDRLCPHLHIPLQSGSENILRRMNRHYSLNDYEKAILMAREAIPNVAITTDILVGFPGENEKEFEESCRFCEKIGFANIHVFPYSPRPDTSALKMAHPVTERIKKERSQKMREIAQESRRKFRRQFLGQTVTILWESEIERGFWSGLTPNYLRVFTKSEQPMTNCLRPVKLIAEKAQGLLGEPTDGGENG